jgi:predicted DNA-binding protein (MmcQ/YjbR family)
MAERGENSDAVDALQAHCMGLEGASEVFQWGCLVYKTYGKVFALVSAEDGVSTSVKADPDEREALLTEPHIIPAPYMWRNGWVNIRVGDAAALAQAKQLISVSHGLILSKVPKSKRTPAGG